MLSTLRTITILVSLAMLTVGCMPEPTESNQSDDTNGTDDQQNQGEGQNQNGEEEEWDPQFTQVAEIVQSTCALATCHGVPPSADTALKLGANDEDLSFATIRETFETHQAESGRPLVNPGDPDDSELYVVLTLEDRDEVMPQEPLEPLSADQIELVRSWIAAGANYQ